MQTYRAKLKSMQYNRTKLRQKHTDVYSRTQTEAYRPIEQDSHKNMQTHRSELGQKHIRFIKQN